MVEIRARKLKRSDIEHNLIMNPSRNAIDLVHAPDVALRKGGNLAYDNAKQFLQDAEMLITIESYGHAAALAIYAAEECAKMLVFDALSSVSAKNLPLMARAKIIDGVMSDHIFKLVVFLLEFNASKLSLAPTEKRLGDFGRFFKKTREAELYVTRLEWLGFKPDQAELTKVEKHCGWMTPLDENARYSQLLVRNVSAMLRRLEEIRRRKPSNFQRVLMELLEEDRIEKLTELAIQRFGDDKVRSIKPSLRDFIEKLVVQIIEHTSIDVHS